MTLFRTALVTGLLAAGLAVAMVCSPAISSAAVFTWDGGNGSSTNILEPTNWVGDVAPANDSTDELHFGPAAFTTVGHEVQLFIDQIIFDAGAPA